MQTRTLATTLAAQSSPVFLGLLPCMPQCRSVVVNGLVDGLVADWKGPRSGKDSRRLVPVVLVAGLSLCVS
jgi:hypothetical protein